MWIGGTTPEGSTGSGACIISVIVDCLIVQLLTDLGREGNTSSSSSIGPPTTV